MNIFEHEDYKFIVREALLARKKMLGSAHTFHKLAEHCGIENAFLSRVLKGTSHLSANQLLLAADYLDFGRDESCYLLHVWLYQRATQKKQRERLHAELKAMQLALRKTEENVDVAAVQTSAEGIIDYFLNPDAQLVHMFLAIDRYRHHLHSIAEKLTLSDKEFESILLLLMKLGAVEVKKGLPTVVKDDLHLPGSSPIFRAYRNQLRLKSLAKSQSLPTDACYTFSALFSADEKTKQSLQTAFLKFLNEARKSVGQAANEHVYQLNFDLLRWD